MSTTTTLRIGVDLLTQATTYAVNCILAMAFRVEAARVTGGRFMAENAEEIEAALRIWSREMKLEKVTFEIYSPQANTAYEDCVVELSFDADPNRGVVKPPLDQLDEVLGKLEKLPADAQFRLVVTVAPGATEVPGWGPTTLRDLDGGLKEEHKFGTEAHGFGQITGTATYYVSNWRSKGHQPPAD
jgi:hypothetical protein